MILRLCSHIRGKASTRFVRASVRCSLWHAALLSRSQISLSSFPLRLWALPPLCIWRIVRPPPLEVSPPRSPSAGPATTPVSARRPLSNPGLMVTSDSPVSDPDQFTVPLSELLLPDRPVKAPEMFIYNHCGNVVHAAVPVSPNFLRTLGVKIGDSLVHFKPAFGAKSMHLYSCPSEHPGWCTALPPKHMCTPPWQRTSLPSVTCRFEVKQAPKDLRRVPASDLLHLFPLL